MKTKSILILNLFSFLSLYAADDGGDRKVILPQPPAPYGLHQVSMMYWDFNGGDNDSINLSWMRYTKGPIVTARFMRANGQTFYRAVVQGAPAQTFTEKQAQILFNSYQRDYKRQTEAQ